VKTGIKHTAAGGGCFNHEKVQGGQPGNKREPGNPDAENKKPSNKQKSRAWTRKCGETPPSKPRKKGGKGIQEGFVLATGGVP